MAALRRVRVGLTGFKGAPGVATFYFLDTATAIPSLQTFWAAIINLMPLGATAQVASIGDVVESTTGQIVAAWAEPAVTPSTSVSDALYAGPAGMMVGWETSVITDGRRVRGKTFIVPTHQFTYAADGTAAPAAVAQLAAAAVDLIQSQSTSFVIWHRPRIARAATPTSPAVTARAGSHALVTGTRVPDKIVVLRSRRD